MQTGASAHCYPANHRPRISRSSSVETRSSLSGKRKTDDKRMERREEKIEKEIGNEVGRKRQKRATICADKQAVMGIYQLV